MKRRNKKAVIERYLWKVRRALPIPGKTKRALLQQIRASIYEQTSGITQLDEDALVATFGTPKQIIERYMETMSVSEFIEDMRVRRKVIQIVFVTALAIFLIRTIVIGGTWLNHHRNDGGYIVEYITDVVRVTYPEEEIEG